MSDKLNNNEFDQDKNFHELHEKYQSVSTELPPASVDENILQAVHSLQETHVENNNILQMPLTKGFMRAWYIPASAVAIIVLSLSVVLKLAFEPEYNVPLNMQSPQTEIDGAGYSADESTLQTDESSLKRRMQYYEEKEMASQLKRRNVQQQLELRQEVSAPEHDMREKKTLQKQKLKSAPAYSRDHEHVKIAAEPERVQESGGATPMTVAPVMVKPGAAASVEVSRAGSGLLAKPASDSSQKTKIKYLMTLYETQQFDKLGPALQAYRKEYPAKYSAKYSASAKKEALPAVLLEWESRNRQLDNLELDYTE